MLCVPVRISRSFISRTRSINTNNCVYYRPQSVRVSPNSNYQKYSFISSEMSTKEEEKIDNNSTAEETTADSNDSREVSMLSKLLGKLNVSKPSSDSSTKRLKSFDVKGVAQLIKNGNAKNIIVMAGAGISVAAGIPDFRTPGTGLYDNLQKYNLPYPQAVFDIEFFLENPKPFYTLAKELYPGNFKPTKAHYFVKLLENKKLLLRNYTQNIDTLERVAKVSGDKLVEAHGSFASAHCTTTLCGKEEDVDVIKEKIFRDEIPKCSKCDGYVKPDIENLPERFFKLTSSDFQKCDLLIVMGTSLQVQPFASLIHRVPDDCPRLLINREVVGAANAELLGLGAASMGFVFQKKYNTRDAKFIGDLQEGIDALVKELGWEDDFKQLLEAK